MPDLTCPGCGHPAARDVFLAGDPCPGCGMAARKAEEINTVRAIAAGSWRRRVAAFRSRVRRLLDTRTVRDNQDAGA